MPKPRVFTQGLLSPLQFDFGALDVPGQKVLEQFDREGRKYLLGLGGVRGGKSWYGARWAIRQAFKRGGLGWIIVPEYSYAPEVVRLINAVLTQHWEVVADHHEHPFPRWRLKVKTGAEIEIRSAYDPDQIRASTLTWGWIDEGARVSELAFKNLEQRVLSTRGPILVTTTPKGKNWLYRELYLPFTQGNLDYGVALLKTAQNPHLPAQEIARLRARWGADSQYAAQELDAEFVSFEGLCYRFDEEGDTIDRSQVPPLAKLSPRILGIDWGYGDPLAVLPMGQAEGIWYVMDEHYASGTSLDDLATIVRSFRDMYRIERGYLSFERPEIAKFLRDRGLPVVTGKKPEAIDEEIARIDRLITQDHLKVVKSCVNTINEFGLYQYRTDRLGEKKPGGKPFDRYNHTMDALRYGLIPELGVTRPTVPLRIAQPTWARR